MPEAFATTFLIQAYADDTATFNSTVEDIVNIVLLVRRFSGFSGLEINFLNHFQRILFMGVNITQRCTGVRTYIYSKLFFYDQHDPVPMIKLEIFQTEMVELIMKFLPYKMSLTRSKELLYLPIKKGGFGLMDLIQQVQGKRASYIKELLLFSKEANPNTRHVIHTIFSIQLQVLTNSFVRRQAVWWSIEHQINQ
ncbi:unnamed protein product [Ambrosiozyma monospora]|uniref:Unnamed protein product n=1 Tax=Ambrosiozyma monospora TaxID=43982 RepID=A0ACB5ST51_AMBMO|nr:unnamed protein product [Ambrosiozyma monospora]